MAVIVSDTFTEASDIALTSHTPDTGTGWTSEENDSTTALNVIAATDVCSSAANDTTSGHGIAVSSQPDPTTTDVDVQMTVKSVHTGTTKRPCGMFARLADVNNTYCAFTTSGSFTSNDKEIFKRVSSTTTSLGTADNGAANNDVLKFEIRDAAKKLYQNAGEVLSSADNALTAAGKAGLIVGGVFGITGGIDTVWDMDDYSLTEVAASVSLAPHGLMLIGVG